MGFSMEFKKKSFASGGVRPDEAKLTAAEPIIKSHMPRLVRIPMSQHTGAPAKTLVKAGQVVEEGQLIGEASGFISANIHASVSGKVVSVEKGNTFTARNVDIVTIETGGTIKNWYEKKFPYSGLSPEQLIQEIKKAGVVGLGGACFPTHVKLSPPPDKKINTLIINGAECEPYLTIDHRMMLDKTDEILEGARIVMKILPVKEVIIAIEDNKLDAAELFAGKLAGDPSVRVEVVRSKYPQGGEKQLIEALLEKEVPSKGLPIDIGVLVENVSTVFAVYEAVVYHKPLIERGITYTGDNLKNRGNYKVKIGTPITHIIEEFGIPDKFGAMAAGGLMMGTEVADLNMPVIKGTTGLIIIPKAKDYKVKNKTCIRCSYCLFVCPIKLQPTELAKLCDQLLVEEAVNEMGLLDCIECGCCAYVCPSSIPIVGLIRYGKEFWKRKQGKNLT